MLENIYPYAPVVLAVVVFLIQQRLVVTPEQLERKHREILEDSEKKFAPRQAVDDLKIQFAEIREKIDKIYEYLIKP